MDPTAIARYHLLERIGEGSLGEVYKARDSEAGRTVALKLLPPMADAPLQTLLEDARAAATLSHPNIATLWDVGREEDAWYLAYEFVSGITLRQEIGGRPVHVRRAVELTAQIADALADAHAQGLIHGDVRPDTIAVTQKGSAKLLDFGMSRWTRGGALRARAATAPGTLAPDTLSVISYLSPEQALGGLVDIRTDLFSLGIVLYEMLTGRNPFAAGTAEATVVEIIRTTPPPPSSLASEVPAEVDAIVLRTLAKDIESRYQSAAALSAELRGLDPVMKVRGGATYAGDVMPLDEHDEGAGKYVAALIVATIVVAAWWFLR